MAYQYLLGRGATLNNPLYNTVIFKITNVGGDGAGGGNFLVFQYFLLPEIYLVSGFQK